MIRAVARSESRPYVPGDDRQDVRARSVSFAGSCVRASTRRRSSNARARRRLEVDHAAPAIDRSIARAAHAEVRRDRAACRGGRPARTSTRPRIAPGRGARGCEARGARCQSRELGTTSAVDRRREPIRRECRRPSRASEPVGQLRRDVRCGCSRSPAVAPVVLHDERGRSRLRCRYTPPPASIRETGASHGVGWSAERPLAANERRTSAASARGGGEDARRRAGSALSTKPARAPSGPVDERRAPAPGRRQRLPISLAADDPVAARAFRVQPRGALRVSVRPVHRRARASSSVASQELRRARRRADHQPDDRLPGDAGRRPAVPSLSSRHARIRQRARS